MKSQLGHESSTSWASSPIVMVAMLLYTQLLGTNTVALCLMGVRCEWFEWIRFPRMQNLRMTSAVARLVEK